MTRLTRDQFNALINSGAFVDWDYYYANATVPGEFTTTITQAEFDSRVAEAAKEGTTPYRSYTEFATAKAPLTQVKFNALINGTAFVDFDNYTPIEGETDDRIDEATFDSRVAEATKVIVTPYTDYAEYTQGVDNPTLTEDQFNALFDNGAFVSWADYTPLESEDEATFNDRIAEATKSTTTAPYSDYAEYSAAKGGNPVLSADQFNALIENDAFVNYADYDHTLVSGETDNRIDLATFNSRVAEATKEGTTPYSNYTEFITAKAPLTLAQFSALISNRAFVTWDYYYSHAIVPGETKATIENTEFERRVKEATKTKADYIPDYAAPSEPYFTITYSINGEVFTGNYNLAAAFLGMDNNQYDEDAQTHAITDKDAKFAFYEGWQNTLNIIINPTAIKFTADVAEWSNNYETSYEIEQGNENPNN